MDQSEILQAAENIYDGWFAESNRVDWHEFIDRLENQTGEDLGQSMISDQIVSIKKHISKYRKS
jgi:phage terminase large subunit